MRPISLLHVFLGRKIVVLLIILLSKIFESQSNFHSKSQFVLQFKSINYSDSMSSITKKSSSLQTPKSPSPSQLFKVIVVGDSGVGKTNLLLRYINNNFSLNQTTTIGFEFYVKELQFQNQSIKMQIWDTAGQDRYRSMTHVFYKNGIGALVVFDLGSRESFEGVEKWIGEIRDSAMEGVVMVLIGNKCDLMERVVTTEEAQGFAKVRNMGYFETSAKDNINVNEAFDRLASEVYRKYKCLEMEREKQKEKEKNSGNESGKKDDGKAEPLVLSSTKKKKAKKESICCN